jgi:histone deacetylase 11
MDDPTNQLESKNGTHMNSNRFKMLIGGLILFAAIVGWIMFLNLSQRRVDTGEDPNPAKTIASKPIDATEAELVAPAAETTQQLSQPSVTDSTGEFSESDPATQPDRKFPFHVQLVYSPGYLINLGGLERLHPFDIKKYQRIYDQLVADGLVTKDQTFSPSSLTVDDLKLIHTDQYLEDLKVRKNVARYLEAGVLEYAPVSLDTAVMEPFRRASGGTLLAARKALETGIGINIGGGYHHAKPGIGEGFCLYADVPISIRKLQQEGLIKSALVVDVDAHQGNGTAVCLADDDSTFCFSMHQGDIYPIPKETSDRDVELDSGMQDEEYLRILESNLLELFDQSAPDICFIVGGCDTLAGDPLASLEMTPAGIVARDAMIVQHCVDRNVPVVLTLSGGYSPEAWKAQYQSIKHLIETYSLATEESLPSQEMIADE